ncbi:MAG: hypothetical protein HQL42_16165 [Alphaproteobacteria bacterium]|nr:hypothetical protein [Alphaproteobacteria bacterium]
MRTKLAAILDKPVPLIGVGIVAIIVVAAAGYNRNLFFLSGLVATYCVVLVLVSVRWRGLVLAGLAVALLFPGDRLPPPKSVSIDVMLGAINSILPLQPNQTRLYRIPLPTHFCANGKAQLVIWGREIERMTLLIDGHPFQSSQRTWNQVVWVYRYPVELAPGQDSLTVELNTGDVSDGVLSIGPEFGAGKAYWDAVFLDVRDGKACQAVYHAELVRPTRTVVAP